jgi:hypothetical protein
MVITSYSLLLYIVLAIFLFCYFTATIVWIKSDEKKVQTAEQNNNQ